MRAFADRPFRARLLGALAVAAVASTALSLPAAAAPARTVVVSGSGDVAAAVRAAGGTVRQQLPLAHAVVASLPQGRTVPGFVVAEDRALQPSGLRAATGTAQRTLGRVAAQGKGVTVAVVDTGVAEVPELAGRVTHLDVSGSGPGDDYGHGTFVAGLVAGSTVGIAPLARVLDVRVAQDDGSTTLVAVLRGLEAVAARPEVDVVNLALSSESPLPWQVDPLTVALDALWDRGVTVVVPAGNDGAKRGTVASPGVDPTLITVGGLDEAGTAGRSDDKVAAWSSRGGRGTTKPDLVAPGARVVSVVPESSAIWAANPSARRQGGRFVGSGTSFSTAVTAGAVAALLGARPQLAPDQVKTMLVRTAYRVPGDRLTRGAGGLDLAKALVARAPSTAPSSAGSGRGTTSDLGWLEDVWGANAWAANSWAARQWSARQWSARQWSARQWSASSWAANSWAARQWSARQWSARQWSALAWG